MKPKIPILFASMNPKKREEIERMLPDSYRLMHPSECHWSGELPETGSSLEENALQKALKLREMAGVDCFSDDSGLEVQALGGEPGVDSAHYAGEQRQASDNIAKLLYRLEGEQNRSARFRTVIAWVDVEGRERLFEGVVEGRILEQPRGTGGFGYDPIFVPEGHDKSFAEMSAEEKNSLSHRARAFHKFMRALDPSIL
jgi:XTP/dITP diphosphohydrolase